MQMSRIDFVPDEAGVSLAESRGFVKAANVACAITKLGGTSAFIGKVGDDEFGKMLVDILKKNGVNIEGVCFDKEARTALAFVTLKKNGEREFMFYRNPSADMLLQSSELNLDLIKQAKVFHYGSISLITEPCRSAHMAAMKAAKDAGILLSYDPYLRELLWPSLEAAREGIMSIFWEVPKWRYFLLCIHQFFLRAKTSMRVVLPAPLTPTNAVSTLSQRNIHIIIDVAE